ncbi:MAG: AMP-binding protein, partial [Moraxellaceae bacterium]|nr:AMP-binding protein [Moraxellaceae bacterium]
MTAQSDYLSPLDAFARQVSAMPDTVCFVQPTGGGALREYTWKQADDEARRMAAHIASLGLPAGSHIGLLSKNCAEWILCDLAIWMAGHVSVPLYPTLAAKTVNQILLHSEAKLLFVGKLDDWDSMKAGVPADLPGIAFSLAPDDARRRYPVWTDIVAANAPLATVATLPGDQLATIVYTSGTTGMPKGVMQDFARMAVIGVRAGKIYGMSTGDRLISYLPLSHVAERCAVELAMIYNGMKVFFAESLDTFAADIQRARPTVFFAVPRIWSKFYQKVSEQMPPKKLRLLLSIPLLGGVVRRKLLTALGLNECRLALSGAAALSPEIIGWYNRLGLEILEVYGMTENMAWSHTTRLGDQRIGSVGKPNPGVECRLAESGEILVKSPGSMLGYYKEPQMSADAFVDGDWLRTGDKGEIDSEGRLRITGRIKEIFKTSKGKYVAPAPIENKLAGQRGIELVSVVGDNMGQPIALVNLTPEEKERLTHSHEREHFTKELEHLRLHVNETLDPHEQLACIVVVKEPWTVENGLITPTLKI